jgi:signal peptide peptidase SppA
MKYPALHAQFYNTPHAITSEKLGEIEAFLTTKFRPITVSYEQIADMPPALMHQQRQDAANIAAREFYTAGPRDAVQMVGRVAVVPVMGVLAQRMGMMQAMSGGTSTESLGATIDNLTADRGVKAILLNIDSPGGSVFGIQELADKILQARSEKRIVAVANSTAASAAYWLASCCSEIVCTLGGQVGSVGVIAAHTDESKAEEAAGVKTTYISRGAYKAEGYSPLTDAAQAAIQSQVDAIYGTFIKTIAKGRGVTENKVEKDFGQGRVVLAKPALEAGMIDRVATLEATLRRLGGDESARAARERTAQLAEMGI